MKKLFIVNSRAEPRHLEIFKKAYSKCSSEHEGDAEILYTEYGGHAADIARDAAARDDLLIVACGGDGTIHEVANALAETEASMAIIPLGTGNDFARSVLDDAHRKDRELCVRDIFENRFNIINADLIKVTCYDRDGNINESGTCWCNNIASIGLDTEVQLRAKTKVLAKPNSRLVRDTAYLTSALDCVLGNRKFRFKYSAAKADGNTHTSNNNNYTLMAVCNASYYGHGFCPAPNAKIDDGLMNCCAVDAVGLPRSLYLLLKYKKGKHVGAGFKEMDIFDTSSLTIEALGDKELNGNYDGEDFSGYKVTFECCPGTLRLALYI